MEVMRSSETSFHIWTTRRYVPEDGNIQFWSRNGHATIVGLLEGGHRWSGVRTGCAFIRGNRHNRRWFCQMLTYPKKWKPLLTFVLCRGGSFSFVGDVYLYAGQRVVDSSLRCLAPLRKQQ
jgi:hypothetical protein